MTKKITIANLKVLNKSTSTLEMLYRKKAFLTVLTSYIHFEFSRICNENHQYSLKAVLIVSSVSSAYVIHYNIFRKRSGLENFDSTKFRVETDDEIIRLSLQ